MQQEVAQARRERVGLEEALARLEDGPEERSGLRLSVRVREVMCDTLRATYGSNQRNVVDFPHAAAAEEADGRLLCGLVFGSHAGQGLFQKHVDAGTQRGREEGWKMRVDVRNR